MMVRSPCGAQTEIVWWYVVIYGDFIIVPISFGCSCTTLMIRDMKPARP